MSNLESLSLVRKMEIDRNHIDNFVLETKEGTKRTKEKFFREASEQRNIYVENQLSIYEKCLAEVKNEMARRIVKIMPQDRTDEYAKELILVDHLLDLVNLNTNLSNRFKLKIDYLVANINEDTSLEDLNKVLDAFLKRMKELNINLTIKDFQYTMFTERYMDAFLKQTDFDGLKEVFEKIYFACPDIKLQLKMNLEDILKSHEKDLEQQVQALRTSEFQKYGFSEGGDVVLKYVNTRHDLGDRMAKDEFYNTNIFLEGKKKLTDYEPNSIARGKNYDTFAIGGSYDNLDDLAKENYNSAIMDFYLTLNELKKYYRYEFMIKDLVARHQQKDGVKNNYQSKLKEIDKEEKARLGIYKEYLKASGVGFLAKKNEVKMQNAMLKMNEQIRKLHGLYEEFHDLEISYYVSELSDSATIYDLLITSLRCFNFLEKSFEGNEDFQEKSLEENIYDYLKYIYNPHNGFLRKINVFAEYNVTDVVAEKYKLLNLNVTSENIDQDNIDTTLESVRFINLVQNVERSNIDFHGIDNICKIQQILTIKDDENAVNEEAEKAAMM